jgi:hypothetical protein
VGRSRFSQGRGGPGLGFPRQILELLESDFARLRVCAVKLIGAEQLVDRLPLRSYAEDAQEREREISLS